MVDTTLTKPIQTPADFEKARLALCHQIVEAANASHILKSRRTMLLEAEACITLLADDIVQLNAKIETQRRQLVDFATAGLNIWVEAKRTRKGDHGAAPVAWRYLELIRNCVALVMPNVPELQ